MLTKGQTVIDFMFVLFAILLGFIALFHIIDYKINNFENTLKYLTLTENAISKSSEDAIAFAEYDSLKKTTLQNTLQNIKIIEPIKRIELFDANNNLVYELGIIECDNKFIISRLAIYNNEITKIEFYFCEDLQ